MSCIVCFLQRSLVPFAEHGKGRVLIMHSLPPRKSTSWHTALRLRKKSEKKDKDGKREGKLENGYRKSREGLSNKVSVKVSSGVSGKQWQEGLRLTQEQQGGWCTPGQGPRLAWHQQILPGFAEGSRAGLTGIGTCMYSQEPGIPADTSPGAHPAVPKNTVRPPEEAEPGSRGADSAEQLQLRFPSVASSDHGAVTRCRPTGSLAQIPWLQ